MDRGVLERCSAISTIFIDRVAELAVRVEGDGEALIEALRAGAVDRFRSSKLDELERWLADEGHTDDQDRLSAEDRRRLTLQRVAPTTDAGAGDVNRVVSWLEANDGAGSDADIQERGFGREDTDTIIARLKRARADRARVSTEETRSARDQGRRP